MLGRYANEYHGSTLQSNLWIFSDAYPGEDVEVTKYCIKVATNSSKYEVVYLRDPKRTKPKKKSKNRNSKKVIETLRTYVGVHNYTSEQNI